MSRPALTKRVHRQYQRILTDDASSLFWRNARAGYCHIGPAPDPVSNAWQAFYFAKRWSGRAIDLKRLQGIVLRKGDGECLTAFARYVPGANVKRLQSRIMTIGSSKDLRRFAQSVLGADARRMVELASVMEVMGG